MLISAASDFAAVPVSMPASDSKEPVQEAIPKVSHCLPELPEGYVAQPVDSFYDRTGKLRYEFHRVSSPLALQIGGSTKTILQLQPDLSYWSLTWAANASSGEVHPIGRWLTFAQARKRLGTYLSFDRFSQLHEQLAALLTPDTELPAIATL